MNDPIALKLDEEWTPKVVNEPDVRKVRGWLAEQEVADIRLYLETFASTLDTNHPARARLLREEIEKRQKPRPDRVTEIISYIRSQWLPAIVIFVVIAVVSAASAKNQICKGFSSLPVFCADEEPTIKDIFPGG